MYAKKIRHPVEGRPEMKCLIFSVSILIATLAMGKLPAFSGDADGRKMEMRKLLPLKVESYKSDGKEKFYDRQTSFRYMDGAAEVYRSYGLKLFMVRRYLKPGHPAIIVELFDMGLPQDALGIFSFAMEGEDLGIGQGSDCGGGLLRFWKGRFFVNVYGEKEGPLTESDSLKIGKAIANSIRQEGQKPKLLQYLPQEGLIERSVRYFHHSHSLNHHYFVSHENILRLGDRTNAVLASYPMVEPEGKMHLLLIQYPSRKLAEEAYKNFLKAYMPGSLSSGVIQTENKKWTSAQLLREYIVVVFDAPLQERGAALIEATKKKVEEKLP